MNWRDNSLLYFLITSLKLLVCTFAHWPQVFDWNDRLNEANIPSMGLFHYVNWKGYHSQRNLFWLDSRQSLNSIEWDFSRHLLSSWDYSVCFWKEVLWNPLVSLIKTFFKKSLYLLFMGAVQQSQGYRATLRGQFTFY